MKRNFDKHTHIGDAKLRILRHIKQHGPITFKSQMGYVAFPDYNFKTPQGAAFSVSKIANEMFKEGLISDWLCHGSGIKITAAGLAFERAHGIGG
jgi:hypothetical protein